MVAHALYQRFVRVLQDGQEAGRINSQLLIFLISPAIILNFKDIDECNGDHECDHNCTNTEGSYMCSWDPGFELQEDNRTCEGSVGILMD